MMDLPGLMSPLQPLRHWLSYTLVTVLVLLFVFLTFGEWGLLHYWQLSDERTRLERRIRALQRDNEHLREKIYRLANDDRYLEKIAREELGLAREGEVVYRFPQPRSPKPGDTVTSFSESRRSSARSAHP